MCVCVKYSFFDLNYKHHRCLSAVVVFVLFVVGREKFIGIQSIEMRATENTSKFIHVVRIVRCIRF